VQRIEPGDVNWMTAGNGIVHSERSPAGERVAGQRLHGLQTWVALPRAHEQAEPSFSHQPKAALPVIELPGATMRLLVGSAFGRRAPTPTYSPIFYLVVEMSAGAIIDLPSEHEERGVFAVDGELSVGDTVVESHHLAVLPAGETVRIRSGKPARLVLLGGAKMDGDRLIWWNFVASSRELIDAAGARWRAQGFPPVPGETEFIPLPDR
jgi:redox-sensitive bicupin YhaK (pirin superfamily)